MSELMRSSGSKSLLDPRTKLALLIVISVFVLGGTGGEAMRIFRIALSFLPFVLMIFSGKALGGLCGGAAVGAGIAAQELLIPELTGVTAFVAVMLCGVVTSFIPSIMMGKYAVSTTTVSEFIAAMERMHITEKITIPLSVMFRFFPTVQEEFSAISAAMKMRDIRFGGKLGKMLEYRIIPMMMCSVKIGDELSAAALTRGLGSPVKRTNICRIGFGFLDIILLLFCAATVIYWILSLAGAV